MKRPVRRLQIRRDTIRLLVAHELALGGIQTVSASCASLASDCCPDGPGGPFPAPGDPPGPIVFTRNVC